MRVLGRLGDLQRYERRPGEELLDDVVARWSLAANSEWLADGARARAPFLQISAVVDHDSVLAWELAQLRAHGYLRCGPLWVPAAFDDAESYRRVVRTIAATLLAMPRNGDEVYVPKAQAELEPLLALWPHVLLVPTPATLSLDDLIDARAWPVHALGVVERATWADGRTCSPAEMFFHDIDHARFKVREDLAARGVVIPDAYRDGSTFDPALGAHRAIIDMARAHVADDGWRQAPARAALIARWRTALHSEARTLVDAVRWLLFELLHEKSLPVAPHVLARELATDVHVRKLQHKCAAGFYADATPSPAVVAQLADARAWLAARCHEAA